ncbi:LytTR family DNA-binding domain-containing protein [Arenibacter sp. GZD96]|uniref:LytR/AlgR family response regulator transcription factor n=1 Tax=Aurantibrevibacter litoralis TaxID=3106030 RepID=UPI002AFF9337|nr:LytTR family DNA-binding domain-containing protein [Arenibacter sp. GZD-96]MEA1787363.1 LytTR family DNA-binding domain-containing protein [Arenibacter sp. GZD-96]
MDYRYTIIDPNATSTLQLQHFLEEYDDFCLTGATYGNQDGLNHILKTNPDIVFMHLSKNAAECFQMVTELHQYTATLPIFIAVATSDQYAFEAIKHHFFDYWVLPFAELGIRKTLLSLKKRFPKEQLAPRLCLKSYQDFQYLSTEEILYLKADNNATDFFMRDGRVVSAYKTLKSFEDQLPKNFVRVHQSYILNVDYIDRVNYGKAVCALKGSKLQLPFSKSYKSNVEGLKEHLAKNSIGILN